MSLFSVTAGIRNKIWSVLSMNIRTWILLVMQGLILLCMTLLLHIPAAGGVRLNMENGFLLRLTLPFPVKKSVITIPVSAVSLPGSLAIRKFWLMSQPQKKSMVKNACFQYDFSRRTADFLCMAGKSTIEKTFWSFCSYMVRSCKGIEMLVNLINISYCAMKLLPYQDKTFSEYRTKSVQEFRFELSQGIRRQIFFATFVKNVETHIKTNAVKKALNRLIHQQVYHL